MSNSNFGYDCRNNIDNCFFSPIVDEIEEVRYIRKYQNGFDPSLQDFVSSDLLEKEINEEFDNKIAALDINSRFYHARKNSFEIERRKQLDAANSMRNKKRRGHKKDSVRGVDERIASVTKEPKTRSMIQFDTEYASSIKALGVKKNNQIKPILKKRLDFLAERC